MFPPPVACTSMMPRDGEQQRMSPNPYVSRFIQQCGMTCSVIEHVQPSFSSILREALFAKNGFFLRLGFSFMGVFNRRKFILKISRDSVSALFAGWDSWLN